jgi:hypothetical protein
MSPLRQRFIEDMQLRGLAPTTQRSYLHYLEDYARFFKLSPEKLDPELVRLYELHMLHEGSCRRRRSTASFPRLSFSA